MTSSSPPSAGAAGHGSPALVLPLPPTAAPSSPPSPIIFMFKERLKKEEERGAAPLSSPCLCREQLVKEYEAMPVGKGSPDDLPNVPWGIISVKAQVRSGTMYCSHTC